MNDFTKEELEYLLTCPSVRCYSGLYDKIKSMIDDYCELKTPTNNEWINVHEQLPDNDQYIVAYCQNYPNNFVSMVRFEKRKNSYYFWNDALDQKGNVSHWMPFPDAPI